MAEETDRERINRFSNQTLDGRYRIVRHISNGGTAYVFEAFHEELETPVALKILKREVGNNDNLYAHFQQEARLLFRIQHPAIVRAFDFFRTGDADVLVLELLEGRSLAQVCKDNPLAWPRACRLLLECCGAVEALHTAGFCHRDLNPNNFVLVRPLALEDSESIRLIDFGTAKHVVGGEPLAEGLEQTTTHVPMTPSFAPPEVARGELRRGNVSADTYGLVVTLFWMVVGHAPFPGDQHLLRRVAEEPVLIPDSVSLPAKLRALLERGLSKRAEERFESPGELAAALRLLLEPEPQVRTMVPLGVTRGPATAARGRIAVVGGLGLLGVVAASVFQPELAAPEPARVVAAPPPAPSVLSPELEPERPVWSPALPAAPPPATARSNRPDIQAEVKRLGPALRRCNGAPAGRVFFELDNGLRKIDLEDVDDGNRWHTCARHTLRRVRGRGEVDLYL